MVRCGVESFKKDLWLAPDHIVKTLVLTWNWS